MVLSCDAPDVIPTLVDTLRDGRVVILQADTMYGFFGVVPETDAEIRRIKGREAHKPFIQLIPSECWVSRFTDMPVPPRIKVFWPGPLTLILKTRDGSRVALRIPADDQLRKIIEAVGKPLYSTSVNRTGQSPLSDIRMIIREFEQHVALVVDSGNLDNSVPSTVVDVTTVPFRMVRQGALEIPSECLMS